MKVEFCPTCGSGKVSKVGMLGDDFRCLQCGWTGKEREVLVTNVPADSQEVALQVAQTFLLHLSNRASIPIGMALLESGILQTEAGDKVMARVLRATVTAAFTAALNEVDLIQKEIADGTADTRSS